MTGRVRAAPASSIRPIKWQSHPRSLAEAPPQGPDYPVDMWVFGRGTPARTVVKSYGRDSLLVWINPLLAAIQASLGLRVGLRSQADVVDRMQADVLAMADRGYRVVSSEEYDLPVILAPGQRASYYRVTYELSRPGARQA